ncbi:hypothetical protein [Bacillus paranthracis]|uniref:hypothetical protein n=1 Tax=Bacillus paranthracis TaxID=2026186 RepID=UPI002845434A|nr:hypothetical protein [Bacillus paranthracis]MDR4144979.1 hypothetical protein [Bacillus paranthracis]MDR4390427.1 hypothetical protein [Bacillus paranthracis]MED1078240.1 hypothetical protein [Bacillus paranthracis]
MNELLKRLEQLEGMVSDLNQRVEVLENQSEDEEQNEPVWKRNGISDYMIKVVYPGIYREKDKPKAAFPNNRRKIAEKIEVGQYMFIYATSPEKKIIGLTKVTSSIKEVGGRWPYLVDLEWVVGPKPGIRFKEAGLDIRPLPGDTLFSIADEKAQEMIALLNEQPDLDQGMLDYLAKKYSDKEQF